MNKLTRLAAGFIVGVSAVLCLSALGTASTVQTGLPDHIAVAAGDGAVVIDVAHRNRARSRDRKFTRRNYRKHHRKFHKRYHRRDRRYKRGHRRFHRHYKKRHRGPTIYFDLDSGYYDPHYYSPRYYDPYYYGPPYRSRISCKQARRLVQRHGYRRVRAYDCKGKVYGFIGHFKGKRYKIRASAYSGAILSRRRY